MNRGPWLMILPAAVAVVPTPASAAVYLTIQAAQQAMFPGASFVAHDLAFTPEQRSIIAKASVVGSFDRVQRVWDVRSGKSRAGRFSVDRVLGTHEMITYAVALPPEGV